MNNKIPLITFNN